MLARLRWTGLFGSRQFQHRNLIFRPLRRVLVDLPASLHSPALPDEIVNLTGMVADLSVKTLQRPATSMIGSGATVQRLASARSRVVPSANSSASSLTDFTAVNPGRTS